MSPEMKMHAMDVAMKATFDALEPTKPKPVYQQSVVNTSEGTGFPCTGCERIIPDGTKVWMVADRPFCDPCYDDTDKGWEMYRQAREELDECIKTLQRIQGDASDRVRRVAG